MVAPRRQKRVERPAFLLVWVAGVLGDNSAMHAFELIGRANPFRAEPKHWVCGVLVALLAVSGLAPAAAQDGAKPVYRCPGPPVLYTDAITTTEARERGCRSIEGAPITIVQGARPKAPSGPAGAAPAAGNAASRPADSRIEPAAQRARDSDARRILADELRREEERLVIMQKDFNNGEPERRGDERNFQKYQDRVSDMKASIARKEADIAAIRREMGKLAPS